MALAATSLPYGLRDVKLTPVAFDGSTPGTAVDLPNARTFTFSESEDYEVLRGDDREVASRGNGPTVEWELEGGGISLEAYAVMAGGTVVITGTTPNQVKRYTKLGTDTRPSFRAEGIAISESGGDLHGIVYLCKADDNLQGTTMEDGSFSLMSASGTGRQRASDGKLYDFVQNETANAALQAT
jgi:hypothetical protein